MFLNLHLFIQNNLLADLPDLTVSSVAAFSVSCILSIMEKITCQNLSFYTHIMSSIGKDITSFIPVYLQHFLLHRFP